MSREISIIVTGMSYLEGPRWHDQRIWFSEFRYQPRVLGGRGLAATSGPRPRSPGSPRSLAPGRPPADCLHARRPPAAPRGSTAPSSVTRTCPASSADISMTWWSTGRAFVGEFGFDLMSGADLKPAWLRVDPDGTVTKVAGDMWFPNGSVITEDGTLLVDETFGNRVSAFDITEDGTLQTAAPGRSSGNSRATASREDARPGRRRPRGCCPDADGAMWIADGLGRPGHPGRHGGEVTRNPGRHRRLRLHARRSRRPHLVHLRRTRFPGGSPQERSRGEPDDRRVDTPRAGLP